MPTNDNEIATNLSSDVHGQAALLLVESLIHGLCENSTLGSDEAVEIADRAVNVQAELAEAADGAAAPMWLSHGLLSTIATSLRADGGRPPAPPRLVT